MIKYCHVRQLVRDLVRIIFHRRNALIPDKLTRYRSTRTRIRFYFQKIIYIRVSDLKRPCQVRLSGNA